MTELAWRMPHAIGDRRSWIAAHLGPVLWSGGFERVRVRIGRVGAAYRCRLRAWNERGATLSITALASSRDDALIAAARRFARACEAPPAPPGPGQDPG